MKRFSQLAAMLIVVTVISAAAASASSSSTAKVPAFPGILANARYVYVASYDGDQFNPNLLPEDRNAIGAVQDAIHDWGRLTLVYRRSEADIVILVTSRPSEDVLAVYDAHQGPSGIFCGGSWVGLVSSPAKLPSSPSLKKGSRGCKSTISLHARALRSSNHMVPADNTRGRHPWSQRKWGRVRSGDGAIRPFQQRWPTVSAVTVRRIRVSRNSSPRIHAPWQS